MGLHSLRQDRQAICARLEARRDEIERDLLNRIKSVADSAGITDPEYVDGLPRAVTAGLTYGLDAIKCSELHMRPIPAVLLSQARLAARNGLPVDAVVRRYAACDTLVKDLLTKEAEEAGLVERVKLSDLLRIQGVLFDRLVAAVSEEHRLESERVVSPTLRRLAIVKGLLAGEALDTSELRYDFDVCHIAAIAGGPGALSVVTGLANALDCVAFLVRNGNHTVWAWLGRREQPDIGQIEELVASHWPERVTLAIGEAACGLAGWRRTYHQAEAAFAIAARRPGSLIRYANVATLASIARDELLSASLRDLYLAPLSGASDGGVTLRLTLRAYFAANRNGASTAAALKVSRQTVLNRLKSVEDRVGRPLSACASEIETALALDDLASPAKTEVLFNPAT
ncbi:MAG: hypothetical protein QOF13_79 [Solirubrobacterales bacterium]|nr:hypothetical protein [Solirubrobacterales bacterium]